MNRDGVELYSVLTLKEAGDMWNKSPLTVQFKLMRMENKDNNLVLLRKSGGTWLTTLNAMILAYGPPVNERKEYE